MSGIPFISLGVAGAFSFVARKQRSQFSIRPYFFWFVYFHMAAVGLHQFEEYGFPGDFRSAFVNLFGAPRTSTLMPSVMDLELFNAFVLTLVFFLLGLLGTRLIWVGLALLFVNFGNGFFHLIQSVIQMSYVPGAVTGTLLYMPLGMLSVFYAVERQDIDRKHLLLAFAVGTAGSLIPFIHVWMLHWTT